MKEEQHCTYGEMVHRERSYKGRRLTPTLQILGAGASAFELNQNVFPTPQVGEESEDDVLLVSDWDEDADGTLLRDCYIVDPSGLGGEPYPAELGPATVVTKRNGMGIARGSTDKIDQEGGDKDEDVDVDVLLVGDYEPVTEEDAALFETSLPGADGTKATESTEVTSIW